MGKGKHSALSSALSRVLGLACEVGQGVSRRQEIIQRASFTCSTDGEPLVRCKVLELTGQCPAATTCLAGTRAPGSWHTGLCHLRWAHKWPVTSSHYSRSLSVDPRV